MPNATFGLPKPSINPVSRPYVLPANYISIVFYYLNPAARPAAYRGAQHAPLSVTGKSKWVCNQNIIRCCQLVRRRKHCISLPSVAVMENACRHRQKCDRSGNRNLTSCATRQSGASFEPHALTITDYIEGYSNL